MSTPCISVIVPVYNTEKFLHQCIDSILKQTFNDFELILIDDGSTDYSGTICDEYAIKDSRIKIFHQENQGVSAARNVGIDNAQGEYITFVDSDDYIINYALEILYKDIVNFDADISCVAEGKTFSSVIEAMNNSKHKIWRDVESIRNSLLDNGYTYSSCRKLYKKDFIGDIRFENGRKIHEDSFFVFCCLFKKPVVVLRNANIYYYRNNPESASHSDFSDKFFDILYFANKKKEMIDISFPEFKSESNNMVIKANMALLEIYLKANERVYNKDIRDCIKTIKKLKKYFVPVTKINKLHFFVITHNLYFLYKFCYRIKQKIK